MDALLWFLNPGNLLLVLASVTGGFVVGLIPGLGVILAIVILLPFTLAAPPDAGIATLMAIFIGSAAGGSVSAILLGIPGTPMAAATVMDGYPLAQKPGGGSRALGFAITASVCGGIVSLAALVFLSPLLARVALNFGPPEYTLLALLGLTTVAFVGSGSTVKGMMAACIGLILAMIGTDQATSFHRFSFGTTVLTRNLKNVPILLGLFAVPEFMRMLEADAAERRIAATDLRPRFPKLKEVARYWSTYLKSSVIGTLIGALPGAGADIAAWISYSEAKRSARKPEEFGHGAPAGVIAPEAANNAVTGGALIPMLTLAVPGNAVTAILMAVLFMHGLIPGPRLFTQAPEFLQVLQASILFANIALLIVGMFLTPYLAIVLRLKRPYLLSTLFLVSALGVWGITLSLFDLWVMLAIGVVSYLLRKLRYPMAPVVLGFILGPLVEQNLRRSLTLSRGSLGIFFTRPYSIAIMAIFGFAIWAALKSARTGLAAQKEVMNQSREE